MIIRELRGKGQDPEAQNKDSWMNQPENTEPRFL